MCHIFYCITLAIDLAQRVITYIFACLLFVIIFFLLLGSWIAGMTYGYKYYVAEYLTINKTINEIRRIAVYPQAKLSEFDPRYYKDLRSYYKFIVTSTTTTPSTTTTTQPTQAPLVPQPDSSRKGGKPGIPVRDLMIEDKMDDTELDKDDSLIPRATVAAVSSSVRDMKRYVSKFKPDTIKETVTSSQSPSDPNENLSKLKYLLKLNKNKGLINVHKDTKRYSEFSGFPVINFVPMRPSRPPSSGKSSGGIKPEVTAKENLMRRTPDMYNAVNVRANVSDTTTAAVVTTKKGVAIEILQKKLMTLNNVTTTTPNDMTTKENTTETTTPLVKEYLKKLNMVLSQEKKLKEMTEKENVSNV